MIRRATLLIICILSMAAYVQADEGMWPLYDLGKIRWDDLKARGLELKPDQIYDPAGGGVADAVVRLGATASFVSPKGLIITNHHVAYGAVQRQSTIDQNYLRDGFYAKTLAEEIPAIGMEARVTLSIQDVTARVLGALNERMDDLEREKAIDLVTKEIVAESEKDRDVDCSVAEMSGGLQYMLHTFFKIKDIRLVYVPPLSIGKFGGEIDNWMWPRHTGDFSFLRAYVAPDGSSAEYSRDNVPYHPEVYLPISSAGLKRGDLTLMMGFPGRTNRYASSYRIENLVAHYYPMTNRTLEDRLKILDDAAASDSAVAIRLASDIAGVNNVLKKNLGVYDGLVKFNALSLAKKRESLLIEFMNSKPEFKVKYGNLLPELEKLTAEELKTQDKDHILGSMISNCDLLRAANGIYKRAVEREKEDIQREKGYQERDRKSAGKRLKEMQINLLPEVDRKMMRYFLLRALNLPEGQKIETIEKMFGDKIDRERQVDKYLDDAFSRTGIGDPDRRLAMFDMTAPELEKLDDPFIKLAIALKPELDKQDEREKRFSGAHSRLDPKLVAAYSELNNGEFYPDANGTMRLNFGSVEGYGPRDAVDYFYLTSLKGIMEKETGKDPFIVPEELKDTFYKKDFGGYVDPVIHDVPVNILTDNDGTNGNSGSPVLNGKGELVGLDFDGVIESVVDDYLYTPEISRSIIVDIRYVLFIIDRVYHLDALKNELTIH